MFLLKFYDEQALFVYHLNLFSFQMPDAVVYYNLSNGKFEIIQQQNLLQERTCVLYGTASVGPTIDNKSNSMGSQSHGMIFLSFMVVKIIKWFLVMESKLV